MQLVLGTKKGQEGLEIQLLLVKSVNINIHYI